MEICFWIFGLAVTMNVLLWYVTPCMLVRRYERNVRAWSCKPLKSSG